jgi:multiple sugar transport system ATP-binding protein
VRDPQVFLFDEPLSNLDAKLRVQMRIEIKALHQRLKTTTIYVTHDQIEAMTMADRIVVMHDGIVEQIGTPLELYDHPANTFVAGFIGSPAMNFVPGTLRADGGGLVLEASGGRLALPTGCKGRDGQKVTFGIRPEHLAMSATGPDSFDAEVEVVEPTGADTHVVANVFGQQIQAIFTERHNFAPGARIALKPRPEAIHIFDAESGRHL